MTAALTLDAAPRPRPDVVAVELDGETVVYKPDGTLHKLDAVATALWQQLDGEVTLGGLVDDLVAVYPSGDRTVIARDVLAYAERLAGYGLIEVPSASSEQRAAAGPATHDR